MTRTKSTLATRLTLIALTALFAGMALNATFPDFFRGLVDGLRH
jgi:hypothetical protein